MARKKLKNPADVLKKLLIVYAIDRIAKNDEEKKNLLRDITDGKVRIGDNEAAYLETLFKGYKKTFWTKVQKYYVQVTNNIKKARTFMTQGVSLIEDDTEAALDLFRQTEQLHPENADINKYIAVCCQKQGRFAEAVHYWERYFKGTPDLTDLDKAMDYVKECKKAIEKI